MKCKNCGGRLIEIPALGAVNETVIAHAGTHLVVCGSREDFVRAIVADRRYDSLPRAEAE